MQRGWATMGRPSCAVWLGTPRCPVCSELMVMVLLVPEAPPPWRSLRAGLLVLVAVSPLGSDLTVMRLSVVPLDRESLARLSRYTSPTS